MTMSDNEVQCSKTAEENKRTATEKELSNGQEVNKAKHPADGGGSMLQTADVNCAGNETSAVSQAHASTTEKVKRCISFPKDSFVSGYCDPPDPWKRAPKWTAQDVLSAYKKSCEKHGAKPLNKVIQQVEVLACNGKRADKLILKGEKIDGKQCEAFEEILRRVQFKSIDLESCHLDDETAVAWFDMIEYYESTCHLNISFNKNIGVRGWQACSRLIRRTPCLSTLDLRNCDMNDRSIPIFGRALKLGSHLTILHMENMYLSGRSLIILVAALKMNEILQELFLADNRLMPSDGIQLGNLLKYNHSLSLLDLRNNHLQDVGVGHVCEGLYEQNLDKGLRTLVLWNNQVTYQAMASLSRALGSTKCLETLNLGHNNVTNEGIHILKDGLLKSKSLMRLGLQATRLTCEGAVALAEYVADSLHLLRLDLRENDIKTAGLMALSLALKVNESVTRMDIDKETKKESGMKDYADQQRRLQQEILSFIERNQQRVLQREEEERQKLEERAQVEMAARESVQSVITSAQEAIQAHPEIMYIPATSPEPEEKHRPSLLFQPHRLTPQESLESPHCPDITFFSEQKEAAVVVPEMSMTVSSPPLTLELPNPLTSQPAATSSSGSSEGDGMSLPLSNPLAARLRSPPAELLLSPQYYPKPTARKIFNVSRVVEASPASPTVSKTGVLDTGATGESTTPAMKLSGGRGSSGMGRAPSPISPTILCQDLSVKTVNDYIQQIVSEPEEVDAEREALCMADSVEGLMTREGEKGARQSQTGLGSLPTEEETEDGSLDPLGVMQAEVSPVSGKVASSVVCDKALSSASGPGVGDTCSHRLANNELPSAEKRSVEHVGDELSDECETNKSGKANQVMDSLSSVSTNPLQSIPSATEAEHSGDCALSSPHTGQQQRLPRPQVDTVGLLPAPESNKEQGAAATECGGAESAAQDGKMENEKAGMPDSEEKNLSQPLMQKPTAGLPEPEPSPLFKTIEFLDFEINEEDLSLFGATSNKTTPASSAPNSASQNHKLGAEAVVNASAREASPGLGDTWTTVDASSLGEQKVEGGEKQPDFFTQLSMNGLTQELASVLSSIDDTVDVESQELHTPDEFERELDAMLASVKSELPWPLQKHTGVVDVAEEQEKSEDDKTESTA